jgi:hypothetical protein
MPSSSPTAARVLHRHRHGAIVLRDVPATSIDVMYSDGGIVSAQDVARLVADRLALVGVKFMKRPARQNVVPWIGATTDGATVTGSLVLHAGVRTDQVVCWAEIVLDDELGSRTAGGSPEEKILRQRLERIENLARRMVENARLQPQSAASAFISELLRIVDDAEG